MKAFNNTQSGRTNRLMTRLTFAAAAIALAMLLGMAALSPAAPAHAWESELVITCLRTDVAEGDDYRVAVVSHDERGAEDEGMRVWWYTDRGTADAADYYHMDGWRQTANGHQRRQAWMGRTFQTREDPYPEFDESFVLRFRNENQYHAGQYDQDCDIFIRNDDGVGIRELDIISAPADGHAYRVGENIEILARFNDYVTVQQPVLLPLRMGDGDDYWRGARLDRKHGELGYVFVYQVQPDDLDRDGLSLDGGFTDGNGVTHSLAGSGAITVRETGHPINTWFRGLPDDPAHRVAGRPTVTGVYLASFPANGKHYVTGENIEIALTFDEPVEVEGEKLVSLRLGLNNWWRGAWYQRGSGTNALIFRYQVQDKDRDTDGISMDGGYTDENGVTHGFGGDGVIRSVATGATASPDYPGLPPRECHRVGIAHITDVRITSSPAIGDTYGYGETMYFAVDFNRPVDVLGGRDDVMLILAMSTHNGPWRRAAYISGSGTETLVFAKVVHLTTRYHKEFDDDGIGIGTAAGLFDMKNDGAIVASGTGSPAELDWPISTSAPGHLVDGSLPIRVVSLEFTSDPGDDNTYEACDTITLKATFTGPIEITSIPQLELDFDGEARTANATELDFNLLYFAYYVAAGDEDYDGIAVAADALTRTGATFEDMARNPVDLSHAAVPANPAHKVNAPNQ